MERKPTDPIRDLAIEIVEIFANLLREEEMRDAFVEVYERIKGRLAELKGTGINAPAPPDGGGDGNGSEAQLYEI
jgi:hypothetical protein